MGVMAALRAQGLRIPEDVAIVGYDDILPAACAAPPLTTIRSPALEHGRLAGETLIQLIQGQHIGPPPDLAIDLVVRASCGAAGKRLR